MNKILIVSNRLPMQIGLNEDEIDVKPSVGGLATGMRSIYKAYDGYWIGWPGMGSDELSDTQKDKINEAVKEERCIPVYLNNKDVDLFYYGFSNETVWPLFHYFTEYTNYDRETWDAYYRVNQQFAEVVLKNVEDGDDVWIHDYQLLLLPKMIKEKKPNVTIGFFLHIPFPSYEVFRILPWRAEILEGMLGADLLGFHTYDYQRHFFSAVRRLLGYEPNFNQLNLGDRVVKVETFPMGIDYEKFKNTAIQQQSVSVRDKSKLGQEIEKYYLLKPDRKIILSIDRLDYTKGIPHRLHAFKAFLKKYPEYHENITLILLSVPSRTNVDQYQELKSEVDELVGQINGEFATINWTPIWYFYRSLPFESLIDLYTSSDIALLTPVRDGMNLVAKEYVATKTNGKGVLILSEMAGAAKELSESLIINPNNFDEIADAIKEAIEMSPEEQTERLRFMQKRLERYNVEKWAEDFIESLNSVKLIQKQFLSKKLNKTIENKIMSDFKKAGKRILFLDYDGTLVDFQKNPKQASPDEQLYKMLDSLAENEKNEVVLISGRDRATFDEWFEDKNYTLIVEHGVWMKIPGGQWELIEKINNEWKDTIKRTIEMHIDRTPGSFLEEKDYSLVWHYRKTDHELGALRAIELKDELTSLVANHNLEILEGNKVIEVKNSGINKGRAASNRLKMGDYDFILGIGDDWTDEYLFEELPKESVSIKVGLVNTQAKYNVRSFSEVRRIIDNLSKQT
jgi:trehalose 6-phosphate synthase/phosphatase